MGETVKESNSIDSPHSENHSGPANHSGHANHSGPTNPLEEELFERARNLTPELRTKFLEDACRDNRELRKRLDALLDSADRKDSLLDLPATESSSDANSNDFSAETIGNYKLLENIGEGGMGSVYLAEQIRPVRRMVALKLIRAGLDSKQVVARFETERQSLALMDHPNIAKVLDAGETKTGEPYFVMELVKGKSITKYCDDNYVSPEQRVELMVDVCSAVQHAHQKGVIHRDLKPSNILVAQYDDRPVPKVIDFGVAKATHQKLTEKTLYTQLGQIVGTLEYMSPEQAVLNQLDVDTRADVYSLGVILYELLVGETPLDGKELRSQGLEEMLRIIRDKEPPRPSLRLSSQGKAATQTAAYRKTDQAALSKTLRGDLDWIVMKALEKERQRRYDSASRLADDLRNYLSGTTVDARPPSFAYLAQKKWQQNRGLLSSFAAIAIALFAGLAFAIREKQRTQDALVENEKLVSNLHDRIIDDVFVKIMSGDDVRTKDAIDQAVDAKVDEQWIKTFQAQSAFFSGNPKQAIEMLEEMEEKDIAQLGLLSFAYLYDGDLASWARVDSHLDQQLKSKTGRLSALDKLFAAQTISQDDPERGLSLIEEAKSDRDLPLTRLIYADALALHAIHRGDSDSAARAVKQIEIAMEFGGKTPYLVTVNLWVRHVALAVGAQETASFSISDLKRYATTVKDLPIGRQLLIRLLSDLNPAEACDQLLNWDRTPTDFEIGYYAPILLMRNSPERVQEILEDWECAGPISQASLARVMALQPAKKQSSIDCANVVIEKSPSFIARTHAISTLMLQQAAQIAPEIKREWLASTEDRYLNFDEVLEFLLDDDASSMPHRDGDSKWAENETQFAACYKSFDNGNPNAMAQLDQCVDQKIIMGFNYYWGRALRRLYDDGLWQPPTRTDLDN